MSEYKRPTHESEMPITPVSAYEANLAIVGSLFPKSQPEEQVKLAKGITTDQDKRRDDNVARREQYAAKMELSGRIGEVIQDLTQYAISLGLDKYELASSLSWHASKLKGSDRRFDQYD